jgi:cyanophycinase
MSAKCHEQTWLLCYQGTTWLFRKTGIEAMGKLCVLLGIAGLLTLAPLPWPPHAYAQAPSGGLPAPAGLSSCAPGNQTDYLARVAAELHSEVLGCFLSEKMIMVQGAVTPVPMPLEFAFALNPTGGPYTSADLDRLLSKTIEQWKDFKPLSKEFENYTGRLNELIKGAGASTTVSSVKPALVSIDRVGTNAYSVVSIRRYVLDVGGEQVNVTKVEASAVVLRGSALVRLTMQRVLTDASDVAQLQSEIAEWVRAIAATSSPTGQGAGNSATGPAHARSAGPAHGTLLAIGGGERGPEIQDAAIKFSRNPARWVYIPTALSDDEAANAEPPAFIARSGGTVTVLHTRDRKVAESEAFTAPLRAATAVFIEGGRQWRLVDAYAGTRTETELRAILDRNGLISGTGAGATIEGSFLVRGSPQSDEILMAPGYEHGFDYLSNVAIDQHVSQRDREKDLSVVVDAHPGLLGVGIDDSTAVLVQGNTMTVIGQGAVWITDGANHGGEPFYTLQPGARFDLATWQVQ